MMKKYLFMLAAFAAITAMLSCCKTPEGTPDGPPAPNPTDWAVKSATYYGEKVGKNVGFYSLVMENDKDEFRFDFFSTKVTDFTKPIKPLGGDYTKADQSELTRGTYFVALNADDEHGTIYTENGTPVLITDGIVNLKVGASNAYTITVKLKAGDKEIQITFNDKLSFIDEHTEPPFDKIAIDYAGIAYIGEYLESQDQLGLISLKLGREDNPREYMQIGITIPFPKTVEEASQIQVPVGVFPVELRPNTPGKVVSGRYEKTGPLYSWWLMTKAVTGGEAFNGGIPIEGGTLTIEKAGDKYKITTNFSGRKYSSAGNPQDTVKDVVYYMNEPQKWFNEYIDDFTNPVSTLKDDVAINNLTKIYLNNDGFAMDQNATIVLWRIVLASEGLAFSLNPANVEEIYVNGTKGDALGVQVLTSDKFSVPLVNYPVDDNYEAAKTSVTLPASAGIYDLLGPAAGTFYLQIDNSSVVGNAGACKGKGFVNMSDAGDGNITISFELFDKFDHKMSGSVTAPMVDLVKSTRSNASHYIPTTSIISLFNSGVKDIQ